MSQVRALTLSRVPRVPEQDLAYIDVRLIPPGKPAARDEGPRLIPLHEKTKDHFLAMTAEYYIALADKLLHRRHR